MLELLKNAAKSGKLAHGYLFYGGSRDEMAKTALDFAEYLKTDKFDILHLASVEEKRPAYRQAGISIDQIRDIKKHFNLSTYNSFYKFVIIDGAEFMTQEASDALLKTLEEPMGNAILILIASNPDLLPKTILSRLQEIRFKSASLNKISKDFIVEEHISILKKPLNDIFKYIEKITKDGTDVSITLNSWLFWFRDKLIREEGDSKNNLDIIREIQKTKDLISGTNVNQRLALENLILCINNYSTI